MVYLRTLAKAMRIRYYISITLLVVFLASTLQGCFLKKNKCDGCPAIMNYKKKKKVRKHSKGSI
jgi:hypothetical protein